MKHILLIALFLNSYVVPSAHASVSKECADKSETKALSFNEEFLESIFKSQKTATTRKGIRCYKPGTIVEMTDSSKQSQGFLKVTKVEFLRYKSLHKKLAKAENCTLAELRGGLVEIYGQDIKSEALTAVYFEYQANR